MKKSKKRTTLLLISIISIIALSAAFVYFKPKAYTKMDEDKSLISKIQSKLEASDKLDLTSVTDFQWDKVYIVTPYSRLEIVFEENSIKPAEINDSIEVIDSINLILFTLDNNIVAYVNLPRSTADFPYPQSKVFDKSEASFNIVKDNNGVKLIQQKQ